MKSTITNLIAVAALSVSGTALAADEMEGKAQPAEAQPVAAASAVQQASTSTAAVSAQGSEPAMKRSKSGKHATTMRPKDLDLRYCLDLESNAAIAKCAGE